MKGAQKMFLYSLKSPGGRSILICEKIRKSLTLCRIVVKKKEKKKKKLKKKNKQKQIPGNDFEIQNQNEVTVIHL